VERGGGISAANRPINCIGDRRNHFWSTTDRFRDFGKKGYKHLVAARGTADAGEAVTKDAAAQIALELCRDECGAIAAGIALGALGQKRGQVLANNAVQKRPLRFTALITKRRVGRAVFWGRWVGCESEHRSEPITSHARVELRR